MLKARQCVREMREYHSPLSSPNTELRLDMNESTTGCSPRVLAKLNSMEARTLAQYPRREAGEKLVADFLGVCACSSFCSPTARTRPLIFFAAPIWNRKMK